MNSPRHPLSALLLCGLLLLISNALPKPAARLGISIPAPELEYAANWTPATVPNGPADTATFGVSNQTNVVLPESQSVELNQIVFDAGASPFTIAVKRFADFAVSGTGMVNNSGISQTFVTLITKDQLGGSNIEFLNSATAGSSNTFINSVPRLWGETVFLDTSTAGSATFINEGGSALLGWAGLLVFFDSSTAGSATFLNHGATDTGALGGFIEFHDTSTADHGTFVCNGGEAIGRGNAQIWFFGDSTAANATFTINGGAATDALGGAMFFADNSSAGNGNFTINGGTASGAAGGGMFFNSQAEDVMFTVNGGGVSGAGGGSLHIGTGAELRNNVIVANGGIAGAEGGQVFIEYGANGGNAQFKLRGTACLISALTRGLAW